MQSSEKRYILGDGLKKNNTKKMKAVHVKITVIYAEKVNMDLLIRCNRRLDVEALGGYC